jgi:hypothetical protein
MSDAVAALERPPRSRRQALRWLRRQMSAIADFFQELQDMQHSASKRYPYLIEL